MVAQSGYNNHKTFRRHMGHAFRFIFIINTLLILGACHNNYPRIGDVPDYQKPSLSLDDAQKELEELKEERARAKKFATDHGHSSFDTQEA